MKKMAFLSLFVGAVYGANLNIVLEDIKNDGGEIMVGVSSAKEQFKNDGDYFYKNRFALKDIKNNTISIELPDGEYAISLYHDQNSNSKLDTNLFGIPKEQYGFSNNVYGSMGYPKFDDAKFTLKGEKTINIKMK